MEPLQLTASGRPQLLQGEVELATASGAELEVEPLDGAQYSGGEQQPAAAPPVKLGPGTAIATTHRLLLLSAGASSGYFFHVAAIAELHASKGNFLGKKSKLRGQLYITSTGLSTPNGAMQALSMALFKLTFTKSTTLETFASAVEEARAGAVWTKSVQPAPLQPATTTDSTKNAGPSQLAPPGQAQPSVFKASNAGVGGHLRRAQEQMSRNDAMLSNAFSNLEALMQQAAEMVKLSEMLKRKLASGSAAEETSEEQASVEEMQSWLLSIGIASPVTKESAGALYHQQLARQLADFLKMPLEKEGGIMDLPDVYCLFNRARGTELVSPDDLLLAAEQWRKLGLPLILRTFDSGVRVVQLASFREEELIDRVEALATSFGCDSAGVSASDIVMQLSLTLTIAREILFTAEKAGRLCRDEGAAGVRFYPNIFRELELKKVTEDLQRLNPSIATVSTAA